MSFTKYCPPAVDRFELPAIDLFGKEFSKMASHRYIPPKIEEYLKTAKPIEDGRIILVHGLGSYETWGGNRNGDGFPEIMEGPDGIKEATLINEDPDNDWGYPTFMKYAYSYRDHKNWDPKLTIGGKVILAAWNPEMHRVEIVMPVTKHGAPDVVEAIDNGDPVMVSMGCFVAGTRITLSDGTTIPIEEVTLGTQVMTHKGRGRRVTELHRRPYEGVFFDIHAEAHEPFVCTKEHPFLVVDRSQVKNMAKGGSRWLKDIRDIQPKWVHAECLDPEQHYLLEPVTEEVLTPEYADRAFARLLGYYVAEGHVLRNKQKEICGVEFTVNKTDAIVTEIDSLCKSFGTKNPPHTRQRENSEQALSIVVHDGRLASLLYEHGGAYAKTKKMSAEFMLWHPDIQREFLGAFANGDGCGSNDGSLGLSTGSSALANQLRVVLARMGVAASVQNLIHKAGTGFSTHATSEWVIHVGKQWAQGLADVCAKIKPSEILGAKNSRMFAVGYIITPIRSIEAHKMTCEVFNFEVEEDESYVAAGVAAHNCKVAYDSCTICHNKAKNRSEYCKHASHEMGKLYPDGRKVAVLNPRPKFFDISVVKRGADRAAVMLKKVASDNEDWPERKKISVFKASGFKDSADKHSEIKKRIQLDVMGTETDSLEGAERKLEGLLLPLDLSTQEKLPAKVAAMLRSNPEMMIPALTAAGIILQPSEFPDISTSKLSMDHRHPEIWANIDLQDLMIKRSMFDPFLSMRLFRKATLAKVGMLKVASSAKGSPAHVSFSKLMTSTFCDTGKLAKWLGQVSKDYHVISALKDGHRKMASFWQGVEIPSKEIAEKTLSSMDKLAEIAGDSVPPFARSSETSLYSLLKTSGIPSGMPGPTPGRFDGIKKTMKDWWANKGNNPLLGTAKHVARDVGNVTGVGSGGAFPFIPGVAAAAVPLIGSAYYQQKQNEGEDPGMIGNFLAKHPFLTSAAALAGAMKLHSMGNNYRAAKMPPAVPPHASDVVGL